MSEETSEIDQGNKLTVRNFIYSVEVVNRRWRTRVEGGAGAQQGVAVNTHLGRSSGAEGRNLGGWDETGPSPHHNMAQRRVWWGHSNLGQVMARAESAARPVWLW